MPMTLRVAMTVKTMAVLRTLLSEGIMFRVALEDKLLQEVLINQMWRKVHTDKNNCTQNMYVFQNHCAGGLTDTIETQSRMVKMYLNNQQCHAEIKFDPGKGSLHDIIDLGKSVVMHRFKRTAISPMYGIIYDWASQHFGDDCITMYQSCHDGVNEQRVTQEQLTQLGIVLQPPKIDSTTARLLGLTSPTPKSED